MPSGSLTKHLVSSLNRRFLVFDENKQKFVVQSVTLCPNVVCQMNRKYMWTYIPEQWETPALQEAGSSKLALGTKKATGYALGTFHLPHLPFTCLNLNHVFPQYLQSPLWHPLSYCSLRLPTPLNYPLPPFLISFPFYDWTALEVLIGSEKKYHVPSSIVAQKTSDISSLRNGKKKPLEVHCG